MSEHKKRKQVKNVSLKARCIFGHEWVMTSREIHDAQEFGCVMCPKCGNVATVEKVEVKRG